MSALEAVPGGANDDGSGCNLHAEVLVRRFLNVALEGSRRRIASAMVKSTAFGFSVSGPFR